MHTAWMQWTSDPMALTALALLILVVTWLAYSIRGKRRQIRTPPR